MIGVDTPGAPTSEARFTTPTEMCPHPERWTSTDGDSTEVEVSELAYGLVRALQPSLCVETGSGFGQTAEQIARALAANGHGMLITIDPDPERAQLTTQRLQTIPNGCRLLSSVQQCESLHWAPWPPADEPDAPTVDFLWLDSFYELRVAEFLRYRPWMRAGTIACFHDSAPGHGSWRIASGRDLRSEIEHELAGQVRVVHLPTPRGLTIAEVI